jgi:hypothetical protein
VWEATLVEEKCKKLGKAKRKRVDKGYFLAWEESI